MWTLGGHQRADGGFVLHVPPGLDAFRPRLIVQASAAVYPAGA